MSMTLAKSMYDRSPAWMQNLLLSTYGVKLARARYGGSYPGILRELERSQWQSREQYQELQLKELRCLLDHAQRHVPWYRKVFAERGVAARDIDLDNLAEALPILDKEDLRAQPSDFVSELASRQKLHTINTSGTSGSPLTLKASYGALQKNYAFFERFLNSVGVRSRDRSATFAGRMLMPVSRTRPPYWRYNWAMNTLLCSSYHISDASADDYLRRLERFDPIFIDAYPSAIYSLAQYMMDRPGRYAIRPRVIVTSSETLLDHQRRLVEEAFDCRVFDQYGNAEMAACVTQCEAGAYHVNPEYGIVELVGEDGRPVAPGESGELICTGFLNHAMPLIRYRVGDSATLSRRSCECGRQWPVLESLLGRVDDMIITLDGRRVGRLDPLFKGLSDIKEAQIVQVARDRLVVNIVPDSDYNQDTGERLTGALKERVGGQMKVELCFMEGIPRTPAGKFRAVVSELSRSARSYRGTCDEIVDAAAQHVSG